MAKKQTKKQVEQPEMKSVVQKATEVVAEKPIKKSSRYLGNKR